MLPVPPRFLLRLARKCQRLDAIPRKSKDFPLDLPPSCRLEDLSALDGQPSFADIRMAWNPRGVGLQVTVSGKKQPAAGDVKRPAVADGVTLWLDTRDSHGSHRGTRFCHQFHFLASGGGPDGEDPCIVQAKIHRALQDAPMAQVTELPFHCAIFPDGYHLEVFLTESALHGFSTEECPRLRTCLRVHDREQGDMILDCTAELPYGEDPSLWSVLILDAGEGKPKGKKSARPSFKGEKENHRDAN
ncbi:MAG: hypothetical protein EXR99_06820 [Gemmataceae bacterium]|nr:hypothetical protein [Gemmataceae bacterium]